MVKKKNWVAAERRTKALRSAESEVNVGPACKEFEMLLYSTAEK